MNNVLKQRSVHLYSITSDDYSSRDNIIQKEIEAIMYELTEIIKNRIGNKDKLLVIPVSEGFYFKIESIIIRYYKGNWWYWHMDESKHYILQDNQWVEYQK